MRSRLDDLPLFATDLEIAAAVVGEKRAAKWVKERLPALEKVPGFPKIDAFHGGRPVPLVARFYANFLGIGAEGLPDGEEHPDAWHRKRVRRK